MGGDRVGLLGIAREAKRGNDSGHGKNTGSHGHLLVTAEPPSRHSHGDGPSTHPLYVAWITREICPKNDDPVSELRQAIPVECPASPFAKVSLEAVRNPRLARIPKSPPRRWPPLASSV